MDRFQPILVGIILRGDKDPKLFMRSMWPPGGPGGGPLKKKRGVNFKNLLLHIQNQGSQDMLYEDIFLYEEYILFMARPRITPFGPWGRGGGHLSWWGAIGENSF